MSDRSTTTLPLDSAALRASLRGQRLGSEIHYFQEIGSTNTQARRLAEAGAAEGVVVIAEAQSAGRGRLGRRWQSPPFANLYFSVLLRPQLAPMHAPQITLMAAVALAETVGQFIPQRPAIKWPNDILVGGKKLAGILTEASCSATSVDHVILGVGVNLNYRIADMPEEIRQRATSVCELAQQKVSRESFLETLIRALDRCYGELESAGFSALAARWEAFFAWRDRPVRVEMMDQEMTGRARGIDAEGALLIIDAQGQTQRVIAGDVIPLEG